MHTKKSIALLLVLAFVFVSLSSLLSASFAGGLRVDNPKIRVKLSSSSEDIHISFTGNYHIVHPSDGMSFSDCTAEFLAHDGLIWMMIDDELVYLHEECIIVRDDEAASAGYATINGRKYLGNFRLYFDEDGTFRIVNTVALAHYLYGVLGGEMNDSYPMEALKAQAIAAKNYVLTRLNNNNDYDIGDTSANQVYKGYSENWTNIISAVNTTITKVLTYDDNLITAYYSDSNGGETNLPTYQWSGADPKYDNGYGDVQIDDYDFSNPHARKESLAVTIGEAEGMDSDLFVMLLQKAREVANDDLARLLYINSAVLGEPRLPGLTRDMTRASFLVTIESGGRIYQTQLSFPVEDFMTYDVFENTSCRVFWGEAIDEDTYMMYHVRWGHGVGLSQCGAEARALAGHNYEEILNFYYPEADIDDIIATVPGEGDIVDPPDPTPGGEPTFEQGGDANSSDNTDSHVDETPSLFLGTTANITFLHTYMTGYINGQGVNLRESPSTDSTSLGKLDKDTNIFVWGVSGSVGEWYHVQVGFTYGYVYRPYVTLTGTQPYAGSDGNSPVFMKAVTNSTANLREGPDTTYTVIKELANGTEIEIYAETNGWYDVSANGVRGYVAGWLVDITEYLPVSPGENSVFTPDQPIGIGMVTADDLNLRANPSTSSQILDTLQFGQLVVVYGFENGWYCVEYRTTVGYVFGQYLNVLLYNNNNDSPSANGVALNSGYADGNVNFREYPSLSANIFEELKSGTEFKIIGQYGNWYYILYGERTGYVSKDYSRLVNDGNVEIITVSENWQSLNTVMVDEANLRSGPGYSYSVIHKLDKDANIRVLAVTGSWCLVTWNDILGYVYIPYVLI